MEMMNIMYELATTKSALELAEKTIRKQKGKLVRKNLLIAGLAWFSLTACKMLGESDKKLKDSQRELRDATAECTALRLKVNELEPMQPIETDICCDGKASITKKPE